MILKLVVNGAEEARAIHVASDTFDLMAKRLHYTRDQLISHLAWIVKNEIENSLYATREGEREDGNYGVRVWNPGTSTFETREPW